MPNLSLRASAEMRTGSSDFEFFCRSGRVSNNHLSIFYRLLLRIMVCVTALALHSQTLPTMVQPQKNTAPPAEQKAPAPSSAPVNQAVPLPQIADQAEELERRLREISKSLEPPLEASFSDKEATANSLEFDQRASQTEDLLAGIPNMMQLQDEDRYWRTFAESYGVQRKLLTLRAAEIDNKMRWLDTEQQRWQATWDEVQSQDGIKVVAQRVRDTLDAIHDLREKAQAQLNQILTFQNRISEQDREISKMLRKLDEAHQRLRGRLFERDSHPLWATRELRASDQSISTVIYMSAGRGFTGGWSFLRARAGLAVGAAVLYMLALLIAFRFKRYLASQDGQDGTGETLIFRRPFSVALLVAFLTTIGINSSAPTGVSFLVSLLYVIPVVRLLSPLVGSGIRKVLDALCAFYLVEWTHLVLQFNAVFKREVFAFIILLALIVFAWLTRPSRLKVQSVQVWRSKSLSVGSTIGLFLLATSLLANILGFVSLSQVLGVGTLFSAFTFALLYTIVRVLYLSILIVVKSSWFQSLPDAHSDTIERWGWRLLVVGAAVLWFNVDLYLFTVRGSILSTLQGVLQYQIGYGKVHVTLGGTLSLLLLLLLGYAIANIASFFLGSILLPKASFKAGMAYAISRVTYYVLLVGLFFAALISAGLELDKFTLVTGALGVGVGFGLQNIVNNFASGLIVLFERPIRVSDTVEVAGIVGIVRRIGARSSTVLTAQGAEVIFPNSNLVSNQVINWTLSSPRRRVEIVVGVSYSADLDLVLTLLTNVATANTRVLTYPPPEAAFLGFGESALRFQLAFWAAQSAWFELQSEVGLAVFRSLRQAGIEIPLPQRDLHVRSFDSSVRERFPDAQETPPRKIVAR